MQPYYIKYLALNADIMGTRSTAADPTNTKGTSPSGAKVTFMCLLSIVASYFDLGFGICLHHSLNEGL